MNNRIILIIESILLVVLFTIKQSDNINFNFINETQELKALFGFLVFMVFIDFLRRFFNYLHYKKNHKLYKSRDNYYFGINNIAKFLIGMGFIVTSFAFFGVDIKTLLTSLSIVAAAIAIITKEYISDFIVGLYFSFSRDFEIDDYVKIGDQKGKIIELKMLKLKLLNEDDDLVIIPNVKVYNNEIINYTKRDIRSMNIDFQIDIKAIKNLELLEAELINTLSSYKDNIESHSFNLRIVEMKKDYMDLKFQYTLKNLDREIQRKMRKETVRNVFNYISERVMV